MLLLFDFCCISVVFILFPHWHLNPHLSYLNITNVPSNSSFASSVRLLSYIETALERRQTMYLSDIHTHSIASGHGTTCTISDMAKAASKKDWNSLGFLTTARELWLPELLLISEAFLLSQKKIRHRYSLRSWTKHPGQCRTYRSVRWTAEQPGLRYHQYASAELPFRLCISEYRSLHQCNKTSCCKNTRPLRRYTFPCRLWNAGKSSFTGKCYFWNKRSFLAPGGYRGDTRANAARILYLCQKYQLPVILSSDSHGKEHVEISPMPKNSFTSSCFRKLLSLTTSFPN